MQTTPPIDSTTPSTTTSLAGRASANITRASGPLIHAQPGELEALVTPPGRRGDAFRTARPRLEYHVPEAELAAVLVYDGVPPGPGEMSLFCSTADLDVLPPDVDRTGLEDLCLSGSERISSVRQLQRIAQYAQGLPLKVLNARRETHAIGDGYSISQRGPRNWLNNQLNREEAEASKRQFVDDLSRMPQVRLTSAAYVKGKQDDPAVVVLKKPTLMTERQAVESIGATYVPMGWIDHVRPDDETLDNFVAFVRETPPGQAWVHVHCNGGRGRKTTQMILYDMARNASRVDADMIIRRMSLLSQSYNMGDPTQVAPDKQVFHSERLQLLHEVHAYFKENPGGLPLSWSQWREQPGGLDPSPASKP